MRHQSWLGPVLAVIALLAAERAYAQAAPPAVPKGSSDEFAARGQREARAIKYGDWQKICFKPGGAKMVCRTTISGTFETGQTAVRVYLTEREGDSTARLQLFLPVGLYMKPGAKLTVDKGTAHKIPYTWCLTNTCIANSPPSARARRRRFSNRRSTSKSEAVRCAYARAAAFSIGSISDRAVNGLVR
jgi:invasion protein IalB